MSARIAVRVQPGARRDALVGRMDNGDWKLAVTAPPEDGLANTAVESLLAALLGLRRQQVQVARGRSSRRKEIGIEGLTRIEAEARLAGALADAGGGT